MSGSFWYLVGVELVLGSSTIITSFRLDEVDRLTKRACLAIFYLALADPTASFVGRRVNGTRPAWLRGKSLEGCASAALVGALITKWFLGLEMWSKKACLGGLIAAFSEAAQIGGLDDNLVIPPLSALLLRLFVL